jgi:hypothetical protein
MQSPQRHERAIDASAIYARGSRPPESRLPETSSNEDGRRLVSPRGDRTLTHERRASPMRKHGVVGRFLLSLWPDGLPCQQIAPCHSRLAIGARQAAISLSIQSCPCGHRIGLHVGPGWCRVVGDHWRFPDMTLACWCKAPTATVGRHGRERRRRESQGGEP